MNYDTSNQKLLEELTHFLADRFEVDRESIHPTTLLREDLGMEDTEQGAFIADLNELVRDIEKVDFSLSIGWVHLIVTVEDLFDLVKSGLSMAVNAEPNGSRNTRRSNAMSMTIIPIEELDLSTRTYNALKRSGYNTVLDILNPSIKVVEILKIRNFGNTAYDDLVEKLIRKNFLPDDTIRSGAIRGRIETATLGTPLLWFNQTWLGPKPARKDSPPVEADNMKLVENLRSAKAVLAKILEEHDRVIKNLELRHDPDALREKESAYSSLLSAREAAKDAWAAIEAATDPTSNP